MSLLPTPATSGARRPFRRPGGARKYSLDNLLSRSRVTNLSVLLLASLATVSVLVNLSYYFSSPSPYSRSLMSTISRPKSLQDLNHLVIVPGHAIWHGTDASSRLDEDNWILEPYQRHGGRVDTFFQHIVRGADIANKDKRALVVFSGGQTRTSSTMTEAESYLRLALEANVFNHVAPRATTENYALDSFQNLLFSVARFHQYTGRYPTEITVVGYGMKGPRFKELHRAAIRWPAETFHYIGIDPTEASPLAQEGERQNGYIPYSNDLYGCHSELLEKRRSRNPFARFHSYLTSTPELAELLEFCPSDRTSLFQGSLPWT